MDPSKRNKNCKIRCCDVIGHEKEIEFKQDVPIPLGFSKVLETKIRSHVGQYQRRSGHQCSEDQLVGGYCDPGLTAPLPLNQGVPILLLKLTSILAQ